MKGLHKNLLANFAVRFSNQRCVRENVWRRHQDERTADLSWWSGPEDARRRLLHFRDTYSLVGGDFVLDSVYLFVSVKSPQDEISLYFQRFAAAVQAGGWDQASPSVYRRGNLVVKWWLQDSNPKDYLRFPSGYKEFNISLSSGQEISQETLSRPWNIFSLGIRSRLPPGNPQHVTVEDMLKWLPAQVELGCGPSIEAGIPPLNYYHRLYSTVRQDGCFVLHAQDDDVFNLFANPEGHYRAAAYMHKSCLIAEPTLFYRTLSDLRAKGHLVGPVLTNNFDGLCLSTGMPECCLRQHDDTGVYPCPPLDLNARSLLVVGLHADRRKTQEYARQKGLKVMFVDPQGYGDGRNYSLESPQDNDLVVTLTAAEAAQRLRHLLLAN